MIYEVVQGQVLLAKRRDFQDFHREELLPAYREAGITVITCLICEVGNIGQFLDVFAYESYEDYDTRTFTLEQRLLETGYYGRIQQCISGSINVQLMSDLRAGLPVASA